MKAGKRYETGFGAVDVTDVQVLPAAMVPEPDVALTGCADVAAILALAGEHTRTAVTPETLLTRVELVWVG